MGHEQQQSGQQAHKARQQTTHVNRPAWPCSHTTKPRYSLHNSCYWLIELAYPYLLWGRRGRWHQGLTGIEPSPLV
jgi:hypothetical protein